MFIEKRAKVSEATPNQIDNFIANGDINLTNEPFHSITFTYKTLEVEYGPDYEPFLDTVNFDLVDDDQNHQPSKNFSFASLQRNGLFVEYLPMDAHIAYEEQSCAPHLSTDSNVSVDTHVVIRHSLLIDVWNPTPTDIIETYSVVTGSSDSLKQDQGTIVGGFNCVNF